MTVYNKDKIFDIMDTTQCNYANMMKRLVRRKMFSEFVLVFYSISLIVYSLTAEFFSQNFDTKLASYFGIILSIITLAYSLINGNAKYAERIDGAEKVLNSVKTLKRKLKDDNFEKINAEYSNIVDGAEYRSEVDFFRTLKQKCKENDIRWYMYKCDIRKDNEKHIKLNNYLSENFPFVQQCKILSEYFWYIIVFFIPIILFLVCFIVKA